MLRETLEDEERARFAALTLEERMAECYRAGVLQVGLYARLHRVDLEEAARILERNKQIGRLPCSFLDEP